MHSPTKVQFTVRSGFFVTAGPAIFTIHTFPRTSHVIGVSDPGQLFLFGTDEYGRDLFSRFLYGGRQALLVGILASLFATFIGFVVGSAAGLGAGWFDTILMRVSEVFLSMPWLYLLLSVRALMPLRIGQSASVGIIVAVAALAGWPRPARVFRGMVLSVKQKPYVLVACSMGASRRYLVVRHIFPHLRGVLFAQIASLLPQFMLVNITMSFLGLGEDEQDASWGAMLAGLRHFAVVESHCGYLLMATAILAVLVLLQLCSDRPT